jgi:hypothetical protein
MVPPEGYDPAPVAIRDPAAVEQWCVRDLLDQLGDAPGGLEPFALRDAEPQAFSAPVWEACSALRLATGRRSTDGAVAAALDAVEDGSWIGLAGSVEPAVRRLAPLLRRAAGRDVLANCLGVAVAGRLLDRGWRRGSRWLTCVVRSPAGEVLDLQELVVAAVDTGSADPVRDLLATPTATH